MKLQGETLTFHGIGIAAHVVSYFGPMQLTATGSTRIIMNSIRRLKFVKPLTSMIVEFS